MQGQSVKLPRDDNDPGTPISGPALGHHARPAAPPPMAQPPHPSRAPTDFVNPTRQNYISVSGGAISSTINDFSQNVDKSSARTLLYISIAFLFFFLITVSSKLFADHRSFQRAATEGVRNQISQQAGQAAQTLGAQVEWIGAAVSGTKTPNQIINTVSRGQGIVGAALLTADNNVISATQNAAAALASTDISEFPQSGIRVSSLIAKDGTVNPLIVTKTNDAFLVVALAPGALLQSLEDNAAIVTSSGRVIDAPSAIGRSGPIEYFSVSKAQLEQATRSGNVVSHKSTSGDVWLANYPIPNSSLAVISTRAKTLSSDWKSNMLFFMVLFAATCILVSVLMRNMLAQVKRAQSDNRLNEISEQRYRAAIDGNQGGIWEIDLGRNTAFLSRSLARLMGLGDQEKTITVPEFLGLFHDADREKLFALVRRAHMSGDFDVDVNVARIPVTLSCRGRPSVRGSDSARVVIGMALDVTEQRGAQIRMLAAENRLNNALRAMTDSFIIWDAMNRLVSWNARFEDFFGFQPGQLQPGIDHVTIDYYIQQAVVEIIHGHDPSTYEALLNDGRWIRYQETPTSDGGRVCVGTDITEIRSRETQLETNSQALEKTIGVLRQSQVRIVELAENYEQEKIRAEEANHSKSEFLANMSHELRTPLNAINGFSDIMKKEMFGPLGDPRYKEYVNDILFSGQHLLSLINDILDMSKIEAGKMTLNAEVMQVNDMIQQVIRIVRGRAEENRLKLIYQANELPEIEADPRAVKQVLLNLLTNAIKFTPEGGIVSAEASANSAGLIIKVSDSGIGIAEDDIKRLAKPFEQIESEHSRQHEGTGLGLALSKSLVELHGGNFTIESVLGEGTTVIFTLPNRPTVKKPIVSDSEVGSEISRLAKDIADVLTQDHVSEQDQPTASDLPTVGVTTPPPPPLPAHAPPIPAPQADSRPVPPPPPIYPAA